MRITRGKDKNVHGLVTRVVCVGQGVVAEVGGVHSDIPLVYLVVIVCVLESLVLSVDLNELRPLVGVTSLKLKGITMIRQLPF